MRVIALKELEFLHIIHAIFACGGNRTSTAKALGFSIRTLRNKLMEFYREKGIKFPLKGNNGPIARNLSPEEYRNKFLKYNKLRSDNFQFQTINLEPKIISTLVSDYGFPPYILTYNNPEYDEAKVRDYDEAMGNSGKTNYEENLL